MRRSEGPSPDRRTAGGGRRRVAGAALLVLVALTAPTSCGRSDPEAGGSTSIAARSTTSATSEATCEPPTNTTPVQLTPVTGSESDVDMVSFDGTVIRAHWFPLPGADAATPAPTVLMGPGWSLAGDTSVDAVGVLGAVDIGTLRAAGYNVLTWDPRGFGESTGTVELNSVDHEARDVQQLLDWVSTLPMVQLDGERDPSVGMVGGSYGGGIQFLAAAIDCRVDALVPVAAWHSLQTSLFKADTVKAGWAETLADSSAGSSVDEHILSAKATALTTGTLTEEDREWFISRGPADLVGDVTAPTLIIQGTVDTLFTLDEGVTNYLILEGNGVPVAMMWYCDGHGVCLTDPGDVGRVETATIAWLDRYVKDDESVDTGAGFDIIDQDGVRYSANGYVESDGPPLTATGSGTLELTPEGGAGPVPIPAGEAALLAGIVQPITPARATNAVNVDLVVEGGPQLVVGAPKLTLGYSGTAEAGDRPQRVFAQLIDASTGIVIGNQITPIRVQLDGERHSVTVPLEMIAFSAKPGATITVQLVATTVAYSEPQLGGRIVFDQIVLSLPVATDLTASNDAPVDRVSG